MKTTITIILISLLVFSACVNTGQATEGIDSLQVDMRSKTPVKTDTTIPSTGGGGGSGGVICANCLLESLFITETLNDKFGNVITADDASFLIEGNSELQITGERINFAESIEFKSNSPSIETGLTFTRNRYADWEDKIFIPATTRSMTYTLSTNLHNYENLLSESNYVVVEMLGRDLRIVDYNSDSEQITVMVGDEFFLHEGESVVVNGRTITVERIIGGNQTGETILGSQFFVRDGNNYLQLEMDQDEEPVINDVRLKVVNEFNDEGYAYDSVILNLEDFAGLEYVQEILNYGDSLTLQDLQVTFNGFRTQPQTIYTDIQVLIDVDGQREVISLNSARTINGLRIQLSGGDSSGVSLIIGDETIKTFSDGKAYIGEDPDYPLWVWNLGDMNEGKISVDFALEVDDVSETDNPLIEHPLYAGDSYKFPNDYLQVLFSGINLNTYATVEISTTTVDLYDWTGETIIKPSARVIELKSTEDLFKYNSTIVNNGTNGSSAGMLVGKTKRIVLESLFPQSNNVNLYVKQSNSNKMVLARSNVQANSALFKINYNVDEFPVRYGDSDIPGNYMFIRFDDSGEAIGINFRPNLAGEFNYLGASDSDTVTTKDLMYLVQTSMLDISSWSEDARTAYGVIIDDPDANAGADKVMLHIPVQRAKAIVSIGPVTTNIN